MLSCSVIRDLLPQYIENLTEEETATHIREHLADCESCRALQTALEAELPLQKAPQSQFAFLKKLKRRAMIGAIVTIALTLFCVGALYNREFIDAADSASVENAIEERLGGAEKAGINMIEAKRVGNGLLVFFENLNASSDIVHGVARFQHGLFGGYCLSGVTHSDWKLYDWTVEKPGAQNYLVIYGVNRPQGATSFQLFFDDTSPGSPADSIGSNAGSANPMYVGDIESPLFVLEPITNEAAATLAQWGQTPAHIHYYDAAGNELDADELAVAYGFDGSSGGGYAPVSHAALYVFSIIILMVGFAIVRYFVTP